MTTHVYMYTYDQYRTNLKIFSYGYAKIMTHREGASLVMDHHCQQYVHYVLPGRNTHRRISGCSGEQDQIKHYTKLMKSSAYSDKTASKSGSSKAYHLLKEGQHNTKLGQDILTVTGAYQSNDVKKFPRIKAKQSTDMRKRRLVIVVVGVRFSQ